MRQSETQNTLLILIGEAGHGDLSYGSLIQQIAQCSESSGLKFQIFSEFKTQSEKIKECEKRPEFNDGNTAFINVPSQETLDEITKFLDRNFIPIGISDRQELIDKRFKDFAKNELNASQVVEIFRQENGGNFCMSPKMLEMLDPAAMSLDDLKSQWGSALHYPAIHQKMIEDIRQKKDKDVDVILVVTGFGHSYGIDQRLKEEFIGSDRYCLTNFMKYPGPPNEELREQIRLDEGKFAPVGNHGLIGFEVDAKKIAIVPEVVTKAIKQTREQKQELRQENATKTVEGGWVKRLEDSRDKHISPHGPSL